MAKGKRRKIKIGIWQGTKATHSHISLAIERRWGAICDRFWGRVADTLGSRWFYIPAALISFSPSLLSADKYAKSNSFFKSISAYMSEHPRLTLVCFFAPLLVPVIALFREIAQEKAASAKRLSADGLLSLLKVLETIVAAKAKRFSQCEKAMLSSGDEVFCSITQPNDQYDAIVEGIYKFFCLLYPSYSFRVVLARMGSVHIESIEASAPKEDPPYAEVEKLRTPNSGFSTTLKLKQLVIVRDIEKEAKKSTGRKYELLPGTNPRGSMMCFPVRYKHRASKIPFVISVTANEPGLFRSIRSHEKKWEEIFGYFESRISLEYSLELLKLQAITKGDDTHVA